jgi:flavorubredoxin
MAIKKLKEDIYFIGAEDWDRRLFDELIPLPDGTSYNSYLIKGSEKTVLIDSVDPPMYGELIDNLGKSNIEKIDYIISHHAEQDHSGSLPELIKKYPGSKIMTNQRCKSMLMIGLWWYRMAKQSLLETRHFSLYLLPGSTGLRRCPHI